MFVVHVIRAKHRASAVRFNPSLVHFLIASIDRRTFISWEIFAQISLNLPSFLINLRCCTCMSTLILSPYRDRLSTFLLRASGVD